MGSLSISVVERTREIGVMRAIGARSRTIMGMFMMEGVLQGLLSWLMAGLLSLILFRPLANGLGQAMFGANLDYQYDFSAVLVWLGVILVISILASIMPARNATQISVRESLAYCKNQPSCSGIRPLCRSLTHIVVDSLTHAERLWGHFNSSSVSK
jgi:putative ABC transport system permease protein